LINDIILYDGVYNNTRKANLDRVLIKMKRAVKNTHWSLPIVSRGLQARCRYLFSFI